MVVLLRPCLTCSSLRKLHRSRNNRAFSFWRWTTQHRKHWKEDKFEAAVLFCVFGITGSSSMLFVRPSLKYLGIEGTWQDGPWSYRILSILIISPIYATILMTLGTLAGRHNFFAKMGIKIYSRFLPSSVSSKLICKDASTKQQNSKIL